MLCTGDGKTVPDPDGVPGEEVRVPEAGVPGHERKAVPDGFQLRRTQEGGKMISCQRTECPWWDDDGCLSEECGDGEDGAYMNPPVDWDRYADMNGMEDDDAGDH